MDDVVEGSDSLFTQNRLALSSPQSDRGGMLYRATGCPAALTTQKGLPVKSATTISAQLTWDVFVSPVELTVG